VHHRIPARDGDPDWRDAPFARWFLGFFWGYVSWKVIAANALTFVGLALLGAPIVELLLVWVAPALLSALQLFTFGTYLPHRAGPGHIDDHRARSTSAAPALSFVQCFHFGYHWEHHEEPWAPWWMLPSRRDARLTRHPPSEAVSARH
jgi:beta-carotene ketolase (CrtW type)